MLINPSSARAKRQAYLTTLKLITRLQKNMVPLLLVLLNRITTDAANIVESGTINVGYIADKQIKQLRYILFNGYVRAGDVFLGLVQDEIQKGTKPDEIKGMGEDFWRAFRVWATTQAASRVTQITSATQRMLARSLKRSIENGKSYREAAEALRQTKGFNKKRAIRIARTEMHTASVQAIDKAVSSTRGKYDREWNASPGKRTRVTHAAAHGQRQAEKVPFTVGGERLMYPGDPKGSPGNIIYCRCALLYYRKR